MKLTPVEAKAIAQLIAVRRPDWRDFGPIVNAVIDLGQDHDRDELYQLPLLAADPIVRTPAGLRYVEFPEPDAPRGETEGKWTAPICDVCNRTRRMHERAESALPYNQRHEFVPTGRQPR